MTYIQEDDLKTIGMRWDDLLSVIGQSIEAAAGGDFDQPLKPYLRFRDKSNRIIAMPAYIGGSFGMAGIKWIASFPGNLHHQLPRAHAVTILNDSSTGAPVCIINAAMISAIRTASVSGYILRRFLLARETNTLLNLGIIGFGPIGQLHLEMAATVMGDRLGEIYIYDQRATDLSKVEGGLLPKVRGCDSWEDVYHHADVLLTSTVSREGYISGPPRPGSLLLNVSLRDFKPEIMHHVGRMIVDSWEEVCRENTDIENMHRTLGLEKQDTYSITDFDTGDPLADLGEEEVVMFNPMGMAVFDIAIGTWYYRSALGKGLGATL